MALGRVREQARQPGLQAALRGLAEIGLFGHAVGGGVNRQAGFAQIEGDAAAFGDLHRVHQGRWHIGKSRLHLCAGLEVLLAGEAAHPALVAQNFTLGNAHPRLMGLVVIGLQILHRVGGHHGQLQAGGQLHGFAHMEFIVGPAAALQLQIKPVRENSRPLQGHVTGALAVSLHQGLAHVAHLRARQGQQTLRALFQPSQAHHRLAFDRLMGPGPGEQFTQVQIALLVLHQQQQSGQGRVFAPRGLHPHISANQGLDAFGLGRLVKLDGTKQIVQIGDGQRGLAIIGCGLDHIVNAVGPVDDGKLGVQAQMDKHAGIVGKAPRAVLLSHAGHTGAGSSGRHQPEHAYPDKPGTRSP